MPGSMKSGRLPAELLARVTDHHIRIAIQHLGDAPPPEPYRPSTDYDLVTQDGRRLPPKAVFGIAASLALDRDILPGHFSGGRGTVCFRVLEAAGYRIEPKSSADVGQPPVAGDDLAWCEGDLRLVTHLQRERASGVADRKRRAFVAEHGRLFCERCGLDPRAAFSGPDGDACIEVHHRAVPVAAMPVEHRTRLEDLECLCANCHRVVHRRLKSQINAKSQKSL